MRLSERETAAYCVVSGIDYLVDECPMSAGNRHLGYKDALNAIELQSPGTKSDFYAGFLRRAAELFRAAAGAADESFEQLTHCERCGAPSNAQICAFCRLVEKATADGASASQPVELRPRRRRARPSPDTRDAGSTEAEARR